MPFSCKSFFLCPSCSQKRTLLLGEYLSKDLLLSLPNRELINADFAMKLLDWKHSGFSIESGTRIYDEHVRDALSQYIVRAPVSLEKLYWDGETDTVLWHAPRKGPFKGEDRYFSGLDFIAQLTLHIPPKGKHLVRRSDVGHLCDLRPGINSRYYRLYGVEG